MPISTGSYEKTSKELAGVKKLAGIATTSLPDSISMITRPEQKPDLMNTRLAEFGKTLISDPQSCAYHRL